MNGGGEEGGGRRDKTSLLTKARILFLFFFFFLHNFDTLSSNPPLKITHIFFVKKIFFFGKKYKKYRNPSLGKESLILHP